MLLWRKGAWVFFKQTRTYLIAYKVIIALLQELKKTSFFEMDPCSPAWDGDMLEQCF